MAEIFPISRSSGSKLTMKFNGSILVCWKYVDQVERSATLDGNIISPENEFGIHAFEGSEYIQDINRGKHTFQNMSYGKAIEIPRVRKEKYFFAEPAQNQNTQFDVIGIRDEVNTTGFDDGDGYRLYQNQDTATFYPEFKMSKYYLIKGNGYLSDSWFDNNFEILGTFDNWKYCVPKRDWSSTDGILIRVSWGGWARILEFDKKLSYEPKTIIYKENQTIVDYDYTYGCNMSKIINSGEMSITRSFVYHKNESPHIKIVYRKASNSGVQEMTTFPCKLKLYLIRNNEILQEYETKYGNTTGRLLTNYFSNSNLTDGASYKIGFYPGTDYTEEMGSSTGEYKDDYFYLYLESGTHEVTQDHEVEIYYYDGNSFIYVEPRRKNQMNFNAEVYFDNKTKEFKEEV